MSKPVFSIIIPVYNAQKYIRKAIESVRNQTFSKWELLLVTDCPQDASRLICQEYSGRDERIRHIELPENGGAAHARNTGIAMAEGTYITFMDADDYVCDTMLEVVYGVLKNHSAKLTVLGALEEYYNAEGQIIDKKELLPVKSGEAQALTFDNSGKEEGLTVLFLRGQEGVRAQVIELERKTLYGYLWNKFYDAEYLKKQKLEMADMPLLEDAKFNVQYMQEIDSMNLINLAAYHYCKRNNASLTNKAVPDYYKIHRAHVDMLFSQQIGWGMADAKTRGILGEIYGRYIVSAMTRNCTKDSGMSHSDRKQFMKDVFSDYLFEELIIYGQGNGFFNGMLLVVLKTKSVILNLMAARVIYFVKNKLPGVFAKLRKQR